MVIRVGLVRFCALVTVTFFLMYTTEVVSGFAQIRVIVFNGSVI